MNKKARVIAFYLPQYHPIPENDEWWGKGFTEWTNVGKAKPLFKGHYQPRTPADLGYYDLRMPEVREAQAQMAKEAGVEGFMYWHYWFGEGKQLLERPFREVLSTGKPDFPFCLGWANHDWTRRSWNSDAQNQKNTILMQQLYPGDTDIKMHFDYILPAIKDPRYLTVDGKVLFLIYDPLNMPNAKRFMDIWNELALSNGLNGFHFVGLASGWYENYQKVLDLGVDAVASSSLWNAETAAKGRTKKLIESIVRSMFPKWSPLDIYPYKDIIKYIFTDYDWLENAYPSIIPNWDRSPRGGRRAVIYTGSTPELFKKHIQDAVNIVSGKKTEHRIVFLRSWNEWAEGNYVEPDLKFGHGYLDVMKEILL